MTDSVDDIIADRTIRHAHWVERWKGHEVNEFLAFLNDYVFPDLTSTIQRRLDSLSPQEARRLAQLARLNREVATQFNESYRPVRKELRGTILAFSEYEAAWMAGVVTEALPVSVQFSIPTKSHLRAILSPNAIEGDILGQGWQRWWGSLERNTQRRIMQQVRIGLAEGQTTPDIVRRLRGTRANGFTDGVYNATRREANMIIRTAATDASARARAMLARSNEDIIKGERYVATLDRRTTLICMSLDQRVFKVNEGPRPPQHPMCRSTVYPVIKSWREMGIPADDLSRTTRASMNGQVSADLKYSTWLKRQPAEVQNEVLGKTRANLFRKGRVTIDRFTDVTGQTYTLDELKKIDAATLKTPRTYPGEVK